MTELIGQFLAMRYRVYAFLGRGGMAEVYKVWKNHRMTFSAMKPLCQNWPRTNSLSVVPSSRRAHWQYSITLISFATMGVVDCE